MGTMRIELFCDDKHLANVLRALTGISIGSPKITPVVNAAIEGGRLVQTTNGNTVAMFVAHLKKTKTTEVNAAFMQNFLTSVGKAPTAYSYLLKMAKQEGILRKGAGAGQKQMYRVVWGK